MASFVQLRIKSGFRKDTRNEPDFAEQLRVCCGFQGQDRSAQAILRASRLRCDPGAFVNHSTYFHAGMRHVSAWKGRAIERCSFLHIQFLRILLPTHTRVSVSAYAPQILLDSAQ